MDIKALTVLPADRRGRDFVVGGLHGCYDSLVRQLDDRGLTRPATGCCVSVTRSSGGRILCAALIWSLGFYPEPFRLTG